MSKQLKYHVMKKILFLVLVLPLLIVSCNDDENDLPNIDFEVSITGGINIDGVLYVIKGDTLSIDSIDVISLDNKGAAIGAVTYFWDYFPIATNPFVPYGLKIATDRMHIGNHLLQMECPVYVVDYPILTAYFTYPIKLVESVDSIPNLPSLPINPNYKISR